MWVGLLVFGFVVFEGAGTVCFAGLFVLLCGFEFRFDFVFWVFVLVSVEIVVLMMFVSCF